MTGKKPDENKADSDRRPIAVSVGLSKELRKRADRIGVSIYRLVDILLRRGLADESLTDEQVRIEAYQSELRELQVRYRQAKEAGDV